MAKATVGQRCISLLAVAGVSALVVAVAGVPRVWKEAAMAAIGVALVGASWWLRSRLSPPRRRHTRSFEEVRPSRRLPSQAPGTSPTSDGQH